MCFFRKVNYTLGEGRWQAGTGTRIEMPIWPTAEFIKYWKFRNFCFYLSFLVLISTPNGAHTHTHTTNEEKGKIIMLMLFKCYRVFLKWLHRGKFSGARKIGKRAKRKRCAKGKSSKTTMNPHTENIIICSLLFRRKSIFKSKTMYAKKARFFPFGKIAKFTFGDEWKRRTGNDAFFYFVHTEVFIAAHFSSTSFFFSVFVLVFFYPPIPFRRGVQLNVVTHAMFRMN